MARIQKRSIRQWINNNKHEYDNRKQLIEECSRTLNVKKNSVSKCLTLFYRDENVIDPKKIFCKIDRELSSLNGNVIRDSDLRQLVELTPSQWRIYSNDKKYNKNKLTIIKRCKWKGILWGEPKILEDIQHSVDSAI